MPNGGTDNCGMCLWNRTKGDRTGEGYCELRKMSMHTPYWTYCDNFDFWGEELPTIRPDLKGPIYSSGIFDGYYTRIPWYANNEPFTYTNGICSVTGVEFTQGITLVLKEANEDYHFVTNDIYCQWIKDHTAPDQPIPQLIVKECTGDKDLHGIYTELFHKGILCCDFMHLGSDRQFDDALAYELEVHECFGRDEMMKDEWLRGKICGAILCAAIGDAMGRQVESQNPGTYSPVTWYSPLKGWRSGPIGTITDDTQMTWWLAESLLQHGRLNPDDLAARFTRERISGIGKATSQFVDNYKDKKLPWYRSGVASSDNCAAMRTAPVGIFFRHDFDELKLAAGMQAIVTHNDRMAVASSIVVAFAVAKLLRMKSIQLVDISQKTQFCQELVDAITGIEGDAYTTRNDGQQSSLATRIGFEIPFLLESNTTPHDVQIKFWSGSYVLESLPFALYCFLYSPDNFETVLFNSVNESRDSDTVAVMACALCGALNGLDTDVDTDDEGEDPYRRDPEQIYMRPECNYLYELEDHEELIQLAEKMTVFFWGGLELEDYVRDEDDTFVSDSSTGEREDIKEKISDIRLLTREQIQDRLKQLEAQDTPEPKMGAMCYAMSDPPKRSKYICPVCGEKTYYTNSNARFIAWELEACRREFSMLKKLTDISLSLDESSYCGNCTPEATVHQLVLTVTYEDGSTFTSSLISADDLSVLRDFFKGKSSYIGSTDESEPLKERLITLRKLLLEGRSPNKLDRLLERFGGGKMSKEECIERGIIDDESNVRE